MGAARVNCGACGIDTRVDIPELRVWAFGPGRFGWQWECVRCGNRAIRSCGQNTADKLIDAGAAPVPLPVEIVERAEHTGPPLSDDDAIDWHRTLFGPRADDCLAALLRLMAYELADKGLGVAL